MYDLLADLQLNVDTAQFTHLGREWNDANPRSDPISRLYCVQEGEGELTVRGKGVAVRPGWLYCVPAHVLFQHHDAPGLKLYWVHFTSRVMAGMRLGDLVKMPVALEAPDADEALARCRRMVQLSGRGGLTDGMECQGLLRLMLVPFVAAGRVRPPVAARQGLTRFSRVLAAIDEGLAGPLRVETLAEIMHLHPTYFSSRFAEEVGMPPRAYIKRRRVERAQLLLWKTEQPLKSIAVQVGLCDGAYLSRVFKAVTGLTPMAYRRQHRTSVPG